MKAASFIISKTYTMFSKGTKSNETPNSHTPVNVDPLSVKWIYSRLDDMGLVTA